MNQYYRVYAAIDLDAVCHNISEIKKLVGPDTKIMPVIKADGYGHGAVPVAKALNKIGVDGAESFPGVFIANNKEDLAQVAYKLISLDNEKYYHLRQTIYSKRELFSEERYAEILTAAFNEKK